MAPAYILGGGLVTCLGRGLPAHAEMLKTAPAQPGRVDRHPYHSVPDFRGPERLHELMDAAVMDALTEAPLDADQIRKLGVFVGSTCLDLPIHEQAYAQAARDGTELAIRLPGFGNLAAHLARSLSIQGPQYTVSTACSSSANALLHARAALNAGLVEHALVIGVEAFNLLSVRGFDALLLLSRDRYRPFDSRRDGLILGEGCGAIILGRTPPRGGAFPVAIAGAASACDPSSPTNSDPARIADVMRAALADAGIPSGLLKAIKAHGTGTPSNDQAEGNAMRLLRQELPPFTSIKPALGHTLGACGAIETLALIACWREGFLPPTPGFEDADEEFMLEPVMAPEPLARGHLLCNYFGFGGNNTSLVLHAGGA